MSKTYSPAVMEFLARGGTITVCPPKGTKRAKASKQPQVAASAEPIDFSALPTALKIRFGVKE